MRFFKETFIQASPERVFEFHQQDEVLKLLTPEWEKARVIQNARIDQVGSQAIVETRVGPFKVIWVAEHTAYDPPRMFEDVQVKGPFRSWRHRHLVKASEGGAILKDEIDYEPPFGYLGKLIAPFLIQSRLEKLFQFRHQVTRDWCERKSKADG